MLGFERVESNISAAIWRAKVPGGWLVAASENASTVMPGRYTDAEIETQWNHEWRTSLVFIPDPTHTQWFCVVEVK